MTKDERRAAFPKASRWWIELQSAREPLIEIGSRIPRDGFEAAVLHKIWPTLYPHTAKHKAAARAALEEAIRPRRNGGKRGRPSQEPVRAAIEACDLSTEEGEERLKRIVLAHFKPANLSEKWAVLCALDKIIERRGNRKNLLRNIRQTLKKSDAE